jgi:membrane protein YqaA with SNARE-associated domain
MIEWLHDLSEWVVGFAGSDWAVLALAVTAFAESIFFPIPPDLLLVGVALARQDLAIWLALLVTVSSVAGALVGHWIGGKLGRPVLLRLFSEEVVGKTERWLERYGVWVTVLAAFTPIPYKVFAITAGVLRLDRRTFVLASLVGRGLRFVTIGVLVMVFGQQIERFMAENFELVTVAVGLALVAGLGAWALMHRRRAKGAA